MQEIEISSFDEYREAISKHRIREWITEGRITASIDLKALCSVLFPEMRNIPVVRFVELIRRETTAVQKRFCAAGRMQSCF